MILVGFLRKLNVPKRSSLEWKVINVKPSSGGHADKWAPQNGYFYLKHLLIAFDISTIILLWLAILRSRDLCYKSNLLIYSYTSSIYFLSFGMM